MSYYKTTSQNTVQNTVQNHVTVGVLDNTEDPGKEGYNLPKIRDILYDD